MKSAEAKRLYDRQAPERERVEQGREHERRQLKRRLILDPSESHDFVYTKYTGHFGTAAPSVITAALQKAWDTFLESHDLDSSARTLITEFLKNHPYADCSKPEVFEQALAYLESRLCPPEAPPAQPEAEPTVTPKATVAPTNPNPHKAGSREYDKFDRDHAGDEWLHEMQPVLAAAVESLEQTSGLVMGTEAQKSLLSKYNERSNRSRRPLPLTVRELRFSALLLWGEQCGFVDGHEHDRYFLTTDARGSEEFRQSQGIEKLASYNPHDNGYRANRSI